MAAIDVTATPVLGVAAGLAAAAFSAVSYLVSRHHGTRTPGGSMRLLVQAHVLMGLACLPFVWLLRPAMMPPPQDWLPPLLGSALTYLAGQAVVFAALERMPASRLAPLLGLKIVMLAMIVSALPGPQLDLQQWCAVGLSAAAAFVLQRSGDGLSARGFCLVLTACLLFALADICIVALIDGLQGSRVTEGSRVDRLAAGALGMSLTYVLCGVVAAAWLPRLRGGPRGWLAAAQYGTAWLAAMVSLYACFGFVGVVFGNILQSTRGMLAVVMGAALAHAGWHELEERVDRATLLRRLAAAGLMTAAITLYAIDIG